MRHGMIALGVSALLLAACDLLYGLGTRADLPHPVDIGCVDRTMNAIPGIGPVEHVSDESESFQILPYRGRVKVFSDSWFYGGKSGGILQIINNGEHINYSNGRIRMRVPFPEAELDAFAPLMNRVNAAVEQSCGIPLRSVGEVMKR